MALRHDESHTLDMGRYSFEAIENPPWMVSQGQGFLETYSDRYPGAEDHQLRPAAGLH